MSQSGSGTPTSGRSVPCMARRDDKEQLPSSNDIASSSNGDTSDKLCAKRIRSVSRNSDEISGTLSIYNTAYTKNVISKSIYTNQTFVLFPMTSNEHTRRNPIIQSHNAEFIVPDDLQLMNDDWDAMCDQERFIVDRSKMIKISREWRWTTNMEVSEFISTLQIPKSMISASFAMLDRYYVHVQSDSEVDLTLAFFACLSFAVGLYMSRNIKSEIVSESDYSSEQITNFEERIKQFFCITEIGIEYGCSPLHISQYSLPIIAERYISKLEPHIGYIFRMDCSELLEHAKIVSATCALDYNYISTRPSSIAYASVIVAIDILHLPCKFYDWFDTIPLYRNRAETNMIIKHMRRHFAKLIHQEYSPFVAMI